MRGLANRKVVDMDPEWDVLPCSTMERIGVRELRQNASEWLRRVEEGESFEITERGRPVALLVPAPREGIIERLIATGQMRPGLGKLSELGEPLPTKPGEASLSSILAEMRADER